MSQFVESERVMESEVSAEHTVESLAELWAKRYIQNLQLETQHDSTAALQDLAEITAQAGRAQTAERLKQSLRFTSAQAWSKTESLLAKEVQRHHIDPTLIDPWQIAEDSQFLFSKAFDIYVEQAPPRQLSVLAGSAHPAQITVTDLPSPGRLSVAIANDVGRIRQKYTAIDPRVLGFVSMQFHYSGYLLLDLLSPLEQVLINSYLKVIDDNLYMPLQRSYEAAAEYEYESPLLGAVQRLLPLSSEIARAVCHRITELYPDYASHSGPLTSSTVSISSVRDVEMFQVYLCLCVLEGSITSLQEELFPLCVMLYPPLQVRWELVRQMLRLLRQEITDRMSAVDAAQFQPYFRALWDMFSVAILPDA